MTLRAVSDDSIGRDMLIDDYIAEWHRGSAAVLHKYHVEAWYLAYWVSLR